MCDNKTTDLHYPALILMRVQAEAKSRRDLRGWQGARKEHIQTESVTDEQRGQRRKEPAN
ncbi:hypothetical protein LBMAG56_07500 [Verrucomicrobiota bacterium]|nr:hypothetical protein LBMAG56_07500 [Verrucomicrobiota bacterium]